MLAMVGVGNKIIGTYWLTTELKAVKATDLIVLSVVSKEG